MAYIRRYMRPFVGTTIVIQDDAITSDKLDDKAVEEKHLGDGVVSERVIGTAAVDTDEIKDGGVKTVDIGDKQVTNAKLADGTIEEDKLAFSPSTRPLVPGVATVEIADDAIDKDKIGPDAVETLALKDGAVTEPKLDVDAVTTPKIKDDAVTQVKLAPGSVGNLEIEADAVRGTEIQDGAVSEGKLGTDSVTTPKIKGLNVTHAKLAVDSVEANNIKDGEVKADELATDAVETVKIKDLNVTAAKVEIDILRKLLSDRQLFYDDFFGAAARAEWAFSGDAGGSASRANSELSLKTNNTNTHKFRANFGDDFPLSLLDKSIVFLRGNPPITNVHIRFGLFFDDNNYILFDFDTAVDGNWHVKTKHLGAETDEDTGVPATTAMHEFLFDLSITNEINFYIDGVLKNTLTVNIATKPLQPWVEIQNRVAATRTFKVDKYLFSADQSVGPPPP